jgi:hypothetical protein
VSAPAPDSLPARLATIPDPRSPHGRRLSSLSLLASARAAALCGQVSYAAVARWARNQPPESLRALGLFRRPPTDGAFRYPFNLLDLRAFEAAAAARVAKLIPAAPDQLRPTPLGGKTPKGSDDKLRGAVHLLSLLDGPTGGILKQQAVGAKTNEHKAAFALLRGMALGGRVITADAMFCHRDLAGQTRSQGGHYFFEVKDNRGQRKRDIAPAFGPAFSPLWAGAPAGGRRRGQGHGALRRAGRGPGDPDDDPAERLPGLAGRRAGPPPGAGGAARRERGARGRVRHHQRGAGVGGGGGAAGLVARALGHREPGALGARRDDGGGRQPGPVRARPRGDGRAP